MSNSELSRLVTNFVAELESLVQRQALAAVEQTLRNALGAPAGARAATPARRGPGRPRKAAPAAKSAPAPKAAAPAKAASAAKAPKKPAARAAKKAAPAKGGKKFQRRTPEQVTATAEKIHEYVKKNPSQRAEQIKKALGIPTNAWMLPIEKLVSAGRLITSGEKRATTYTAR